MSNSLRPVRLARIATKQHVLLSPLEWEGPGCITYSNFLRVNREFAEQHAQRLWVRAIHKSPSVILGELPNETNLVVPNEEDFLPVTQNFETVAEQVPPYFGQSDLAKVGSWPGDALEVPQTAVLIARFGIRTWGHWLGELLPKVVVVEAAFPMKYSYILPQEVATAPGFKTLLESLQYYGIGFDRLLLLPPGKYRLRKLLSVSSVWNPTKMHPEAADLMRGSSRPVETSARRKVALLRTESSTRNVFNLSEVKKLLTDSGFETVETGRLSFSEQVHTFATAETIVGVLGSGLTGLPYCRQGVRVLTLAPGKWGDLFFFAMMQLRDAKLADIRGHQQEGDPRGPAEAAFFVSATEIANGLAALG